MFFIQSVLNLLPLCISLCVDIFVYFLQKKPMCIVCVDVDFVAFSTVSRLSLLDVGQYWLKIMQIFVN